MNDKAIIDRSLVSLGDTARLTQVMAKARRGEPVTLGFLGGSITAGGNASASEHRWANQVAEWWQKSFPKSKITFINAGVGATSSDIGAHRAWRDLLSHKPDFVVAEYAVNDAINPMCVETMEGLTRQILKQPNQPALIYLFLMAGDGSNEQDRHEAVGRYYAIPMVSYRNGLWPEVQAGHLNFVKDLAPDGLHPNHRGHAYCGKFVIMLLEKVKAEMPADNQLPAVPAMKQKPLIDTVFEFADIYNADTLRPTANQGWTPKVLESYPAFGAGWTAEKPGSTLEFEVEGTTISVVFYRIKKAMGIAEVAVDNQPAVKISGWYEQDWGGYCAYRLVARNLTPGKHKLRITLSSEKVEQSDGHPFHLCAILVSGIDR